ncbi:MAG: tetratricopeptide repeat protein, partial [Raineya sp.]
MRKSLLFLLMCFGIFANAQSIQQGLQFMDMEQYSSAKDVFEKLVNSKPNGEHYYYLGYFYARNNNPDAQKAKEAFEKGLATDKKFPLNEIGLAEVMLMQGDLAGAKAKINEVVKKTKAKNHDVLLRAGEALITHKTKDANEAVRLLEMALKLDKNVTAATYIALGDAYAATEKPENGAKAITNYDFAISKSGDKSGKARTKRTEFLLRGKNPDYLYVLQQYKDILKSDASYTPTYRRIAELYQKGRNLDSAIRYNDLYMAKSERSDEVKYRNAVFLYKVKKYDRSLKDLKELEGKVKYPEFNRWIGYAYKKNGNAQQAKA